MKNSRRQFLIQAAAAAAISQLPISRLVSAAAPQAKCRFGLVTYLWGKDLALPELIAACESSGLLGVELRTTHRHGVEPEIDRAARQRVRETFAQSRVELVGLGSNERFDHPDPQQLRAALDRTKAFIRLSNEIGSSGVKVKGDQFHDDVPREQTLKQVVSALRELGDYAAQYEQQVRLEVHGEFRKIPVHLEIISQVNHPLVRTCWNSNNDDQEAPGLEANFDLLRPYFGQTAHVRQLDTPGYAWEQLIDLFIDREYDGWVLLEAHGEIPPAEAAARLTQQAELFARFRDQALAKRA